MNNKLVMALSSERDKLCLGGSLSKLLFEMELKGLGISTQMRYITYVRNFVEATTKNDDVNTLTIKDVRRYLHNLHYQQGKKRSHLQ